MRRIAEFDSLRGIAALAVVLFHLKLQRLQVLGSSVDLFFVLSGFLITRIILDESRRPGFFRVFYARRALRIFPVYYLALTAVLLTNHLRYRPDPLEGLARFLTYTQNLEGYLGEVNDRFSRLFQHSWTLALEEQFYLLWPLLVAFVGRRGVMTVALPLLGTSIVLRTLTWYPHLLLTRCDGLVLGALLAALIGDESWRAARARRLIQAFATLLILGMIASAISHRGWPIAARAVPGYPWHMIGYSLSIFAQCVAYTGLVGLVLTAAGARWLAPLRDPRLVYLGTISYGIYLWHPIVAGLIVAWHTQVLRIHNGWSFTILEFGASIAVAALSWHAFEKPILRWKDRFSYDPPRKRTVPAPHFARVSALAGAVSDDQTRLIP